MGSSLAYFVQERLEDHVPKNPSWFVRRCARAVRFFNKLVGRKDIVLGEFRAVGFPVAEPIRLSDGTYFFELFVFDLELNGTPLTSQVGMRFACSLPDVTFPPSNNEELEVTGNFSWLRHYDDYALDIEAFQVLMWRG